MGVMSFFIPPCALSLSTCLYVFIYTCVFIRFYTYTHVHVCVLLLMATMEGIRAGLLFFAFLVHLLETRVRQIKFDISTLEVKAMTSSRPGQGEGAMASNYQKGMYTHMETPTIHLFGLHGKNLLKGSQAEMPGLFFTRRTIYEIFADHRDWLRSQHPR